jgi:uncharacterized protein YndB with AHSA1/START domain
MSEPSTVHHSFVITRSFAKAPERVFAAFADAAKKRRWFAESEGHEVEAFEMDFRVGGAETLRYRLGQGTPFPGVVLVSAGNFQDIAPDRRIVVTQTMDFADKRISAALVTFEFLRTENGSDLICTHQAAFFEGADGPTIREAGWRSLFDRLANQL